MSMKFGVRIADVLAAIALLAASTLQAGSAEGGGGVARSEGLVGRAVLHPNLIVRPAASNPATINGTGVIHGHSGPSGIGGPAKAAAGVNGTTIRSKH
jgi:hypothetical protein